MKLEDFFTSITFSTIFVALKLLMMVGFIAHWTACWFHYISYENAFVFHDVWLRTFGHIDASTDERYVASLYWALTTMTTVGYGDIVPRSEIEKVYAMAAMILACGTFAYVVGSIGGIISKQSERETAYRDRSNAVNEYLRKNNIPDGLQFKVRRYLEYVWENQKNKLNEKEILAQLSEPLRDEIYSHIHGVVIKSCVVFTDNLDDGFIS
jgi:hyperpolarization activated cyclic nucleotide-gated potassium channel 2